MSELSDKIIRAIAWTMEQGKPTRDNEEGAKYVVWEMVRSNPFDHPHERSGYLDRVQNQNGSWTITVYRGGDTTGLQCVENAKMDVGDKQPNHAIGWLCAGQAHKEGAEARALYVDNRGLTLKLLTEKR